jgi:hypothetical protein
MEIWISNIAPDATDEELRGLLKTYGFPPFATSQRVPGDGSRPGALLEFPGASAEQLARVVQRLDGLYWKGRMLFCHPLLEHPEPK